LTCIAALVDGSAPRRVFMGADSLVDIGSLDVSSMSSKLFRHGELLIGMCGTARAGQIIEHCVDVPPREQGQDANAYLVASWVPAVVTALAKQGACGPEDARGIDGGMLVGIDDRLFLVAGNFSVGEPDRPIAIGAGGAVACGALYANNTGRPRHRLEIALSAAAQYCDGVRAPFRFASNPEGGI
jgi:ATP-dependent protease HslVU (ClpYQ) peptidase subunit